MKKSIRMNNNTKPAEVVKMDARMFAEAHKNDGTGKRNSTGIGGKNCEAVIRDMVLKEGITWSRDLRARSQNRGDIVTTDASGKKITIEVKTGAGALAYASQYDIEFFDDNDIDNLDIMLPGVDYVAYYVNGNEVDCDDREGIADDFIIATRENFIALLIDYCHGKRSSGWRTAVKFNNASRTAVNIQSTYTEAFYNGMVCELDSRTVTLRQFADDVLGRPLRMEW